MRFAASALLALLPSLALARDAARTPVLPPLIPWNGTSRALVVPAGDAWITPAEASSFRTTPTYDETVAWLRKLVAAAPKQLRMTSIGKTPEGREIWMVVASSGGKNKPRVLAQGGIHSGEIDGKDAGMMLLRDMTVRGTKRELLERADFYFVPIFNADGHERSSPFSRINQRGPENAGWRANARNLNLNRDYMKTDSAEVQAMVRALREIEPDLYLDLHVTDGADYQYDITYGFDGPESHSPAIARVMASAFRREIDGALKAAGHIPGPLVFGIDWTDLSQGLLDLPADPRFSTGYASARHTPFILLENHSLKPYDQRVLGTYAFLEQSLRSAAAHATELREAIAADRARRPESVPLAWSANGPRDTIELLGIEATRELSPISGTMKTTYTGKPVTLTLPMQHGAPAATAVPPKAYWIPAAWSDVIAKLDLHGIRYERITAAREIDVEMVRLDAPKFASEQFEGRVRVTATPRVEKRRERFPAGSVRVPLDQPMGILAALLLEPQSTDSLFQWGFFHSILSATEYVEPYVMEPTAERMLAEDPELRREFEQKVASDAAFRGDGFARLQWIYERTPYYDPRARLYPVGYER